MLRIAHSVNEIRIWHGFSVLFYGLGAMLNRNLQSRLLRRLVASSFVTDLGAAPDYHGAFLEALGCYDLLDMVLRRMLPRITSRSIFV